MSRGFAAVVLLSLLPGMATAQVYRCRVDGVVMFSDHACGRAPEKIATLPPALIMSPGYAPRRYRGPSTRTASGPKPRAPAIAPPVKVDAAPEIDCPGDAEIARAIRRRTVVTCMTPAQVRRATPVRIAGHDVRRSVDQFGSFTEWRYRVVPQGWPVRIQFRHGRVFGYETLPYRQQD